MSTTWLGRYQIADCYGWARRVQPRTTLPMPEVVVPDPPTGSRIRVYPRVAYGHITPWRTAARACEGRGREAGEPSCRVQSHLFRARPRRAAAQMNSTVVTASTGGHPMRSRPGIESSRVSIFLETREEARRAPMPRQMR